MKPAPEFDEIIASWGQLQPAISGIVLIGSRQRSTDDTIWRSDLDSDWDFHIVTSNPNLFLDDQWTKALKGIDVRVYSARMTRIGSVPKVNAIFSNAEADLVIIPSRIVRMARFLTKFGWHHRAGRVRQFLQDLAVVVRPGFRFLKDTNRWEAFYRFAVNAVSDARLSDDGARKIADGFVCDYIWTVRKISRGEYFAAQRMLHRELMETNFRLLHEIKLRRGERTFPEGRRIEKIARPEELDLLAVKTSIDEASLRVAVEKCARACRELMGLLVGGGWTWPKLDR